MKHVSFLMLVFCLSAPTLAGVSLLVGGGVNSSYSDSEDEGPVKYSNRLGYNMGVGLQFTPLPGFSYVFEANVETRGENVTVNDSGSKSEIALRLEYLQIPIFAMFHVPAGRMKIDLFAGPVLGIPNAGEVETPGFVLVPAGVDTPPIMYPSGTWKIKDLAIQVGVEAGAGVEIPWRTISIFVRPSYYHGFTGHISEDDRGDYHQRNLKLKAGLRLPL
jgi:hypothetical protein